MNEKRLSALFRGIVATTISSAPFVVGQMACGGRIEPIDNVYEADSGATQPDEDASTNEDASTDEDARIDLPDYDAGVGRDASRKDASITDSSRPDARKVDAGCYLPDAAVSPKDTCSFFVVRPCDVSPTQPLSSADCSAYCGAANGASSCYFANAPNGGGGDVQNAYIQCITCTLGRRPEGFERQPDTTSGSLLGSYFAAAAALEAASVDAFRILKSELETHGAPRRLVRAAERSAREEIRHTRATRAAARRYGATSAQLTMPRVAGPGTSRSLEAIALENAAEGCVRETFAALTASWQAERAIDPELRSMMRGIAQDETRHAALSWSVARWVDARLTDDQRARVAAAMADALDALARELTVEPPADLVNVAGIPRARDAQRLLAQMRLVLPLAA